MSPTSSDRHGTFFEVNEARPLEESPLGGLEQGEEMEELGRFGGARRVGSFVTSKFVELKTGAQNTVHNVGESISKGVRKHGKVAAYVTAAAVAIGGGSEMANTNTDKAEAATISRTDPMQPKGVLKEISYISGSRQMLPNSGFLRTNGYAVYGGCNGIPFTIKKVKDTLTASFKYYCSGGSGHYKPDISALDRNRNAKRLNIIGDKVAKSVGVKTIDARLGEPKLAKANTQQAVMNFARPTAAESKPGVKPVKTIKLRKNRKPIITTYAK